MDEQVSELLTEVALLQLKLDTMHNSIETIKSVLSQVIVSLSLELGHVTAEDLNAELYDV